MAFNLKNRHLLSLVNHTEREIKYLLDLSRDLKRAKYSGTEQPRLKGKKAPCYRRRAKRQANFAPILSYVKRARLAF